ncbi:class I SAM-dependent methyltransferase [Desertibaculum subflavum]|uniref:class I SAM-dependent methyltransferase n=1 Tax=Desertibaculum subflavum TaxID=2268458 RepID=UPI000E6725D2
MFLLTKVLKKMIRRGTLTVIGPRGQRVEIGDGGEPRVTVRLHDTATINRIGLNPGVAVGEAYMDGRLTVENATIYQLIELAMMNASWGDIDFSTRLGALFRRVGRRIQQFNPVGRSKQNVAHHYDLSDQLYELFLDADRQYSCAYFGSPSDTIDAAQERKKRHIAAKLRLEPGMRVLDIGSGWGGLGLYLAKTAGVEVLGCTLSEEQHKVSQARAKAQGLDGQVQFVLQDYRQLASQFDRIVSVGMFEHVGVNHYDAYFNKCRELLKRDGVALLHTIGRSDGPGTTNGWIRKYIFPGGYSPALSEILPVMERQRLMVTDVEVLRLHYAETLKAWQERFQTNRDKVRALYDERFCRMWEFYLAASEATFRYGGHAVFQVQFARDVNTLPITRDYMFEWERAHAPAAARDIAAD